MILLIAIALAYLLGSIPTSFWLGKLVKGIDIREHGSKNPGATNALRVLGKPLGFTTLLVDILKGTAAVLVAMKLLGITLDWQLLLVGLAAVSGHIFTLFLRFKGGKGVATTFGIFLALAPWATIYTLGIFIIVVTLSRYVSLGSIISAVCFPLFIYLIDGNILYTALAILIGTFIIWRHRSNIQRIREGKENKMVSSLSGD